jgi:penicillin-binding protein 2
MQLMNLKEKVIRVSQESTPSVGQKLQPLAFIVFIFLMLGGITARLVDLQIFQGKTLSKLAQTKRIRVVSIPPLRGNIFDRSGKVLAKTHHTRSVYLWPMAHKKASWGVVAPRLEKILNIPRLSIEQQLEEFGGDFNSLVRVAQNVNIAQVTAIKEYQNELPGVEILDEGVRSYPSGQEFAHLMGYVREINSEQLRQRRQKGYQLGDIIGHMGAEKAFEQRLRGERGKKLVEVDAKGRIQRLFGESHVKPGEDISLTIDLELQKSAAQALKGRKGAIVAIDPNNGDILAIASYPTYDPNIFSKGKISKKEWETLQTRKHPLVNRALSAFPPASTFKIVTTTAALESGKYSPQTVLPTYSHLTFGGIRFNEWNKAGFGSLGWTGAMAMSSDTFFYQVAARVGGEELIDWTRKFGFGQKTGVELGSEESEGLVPDSGYKLTAAGRAWTVGDSVNMSIGQGALLATPLQVAAMFAVPANGGFRVHPRLLKNNKEANVRESIGMHPTTLKILQDGLRQVMTSGTGKKLNYTSVPIAGKTGTAEAWLSNGVKQNHTWFGAYAPLNKPEIVVVAFAEHSDGSGGDIAGPMTLEVIEKYFQRKKTSPITKTQE